MSSEFWKDGSATTPPPAHSVQGAGAQTAAANPPVVIEEIFLEGDSMTMLRHEAGSEHAIDLLEAADRRVQVAGAPKQR